MFHTILAQPVFPLALVPGSGLLFGLMLAAAIAGGYVAHALRIPRVVGYLLAGVGLKVLLYRLLEIEPGDPREVDLQAAAEPLKAIKDLGLGIILFSIGGVFETRHLRAVGRRLFKIALCETGLTAGLVFIGVAAVGLAVAGNAPVSTILAFAALLALAAIATAPAATLFVLREYDAKGPVTDTILSLTGVNNIVCIVLFHVGFTALMAAGLVGGAEPAARSIWMNLVNTTLGSIALGMVLGFCLSLLHAKLQLGETLLILVAALVIAGAAEGWLLHHHNLTYNFLLMTLCMGATFANIAIDPERLEESLRTMSRPILVGFFVMAGYKLHLADLAQLRTLGAAYILCRLAGKLFGARLGLRWSKSGGELRPHLGGALLCQAAVVIGLADYVETYWASDWAGRFVTVVLGSVVVFEISGPLLIKGIVKGAGEIKAATLLRRGRAATGGASIFRLSLEALLRMFGIGPALRRRGNGPLRVRHIMRTSVKCLPAEADFDAVLNFAEQSRFNHFPVVDDGDRLVGVIHFSQIREILYDPTLSYLMTAMDLSNPRAGAVHADMPLAEAMRVFQEGDVGSLPVVETADSRHVVGIIEQRDLLRAVHLHRDAK
ncbi:MAG: CBS domain-containing protein [Phycisphaerae bacterium]